jgi:GDP-L-fucose synthase
VRRLQAGGYTNLLLRSRAELDLAGPGAVLAFLAEQKPDYIFIAAAKVGGIQANNTYRAEFIYQNLRSRTT